MEYKLNYEKTKFKEFEVYEDKYSNIYEYICKYSVDVQFSYAGLDDPYLRKICETNVLSEKRNIVVRHDTRPEELQSAIAPQDEEEGTVDYAINDFINENLKTDEAKFKFVNAVFNWDIPEHILDKAEKGEMQLGGLGEVKYVDYDYRKPEVKKIMITYTNGKSYNVGLPKPVTNRNVDMVVPDETLPSIYNSIEEWLGEDYEGTIQILNEIFGIDFKTLKGGIIK